MANSHFDFNDLTVEMTKPVPVSIFKTTELIEELDIERKVGKFVSTLKCFISSTYLDNLMPRGAAMQ